MPLWTLPPSLRSISLHHLRKHARPLLFRFALTLSAVIFLNDNILEVTSIEGSSMSPALSPHYHAAREEDKVLWRKWRVLRDLKRGDVVHFDNPCYPDRFAVKRVIALEGDTVMLDSKRRPAWRDGSEAPEAASWDAWKGRVRVPAGHVWVEGDNRARSKDSNYYGPISKSLINGRAVAVVWPSARFMARPWEGFQSRTKVVEGKEVPDWVEGLPIELAEIAEPHLPR